jgi:hypothetical protein
MTSFARVSALALLAAAVGIVLQIIGGAEYPAVPPGIVLLVVAAGIVAFAPSRWAPIAAVLAGAFLLVGMFAAGQAARLVDIDTVLNTTGLWVQTVAVVIAIVTGAMAMQRPGDRAARV